MQLELNGKTALVTGASSGVGAAIARSLSAEGCNVVIADRDMDRAPQVVADCTSKGSRAAAVHVDLGDAESATSLVERAEQALGPLDILINNAGFWPQNVVTEIPLSEWQLTFDVNMTAVFLTSQAFVRNTLARGRRGKILNVTSQAAFHGSTTGHAHYAASKSAVVTFTISLSREVAAKGINVNALALGIVETPMSAEVLRTRRDDYIKRIPIGRLAKPEDVAGVAVFLVSGAADYLTGATFDATGGMLTR